MRYEMMLPYQVRRAIDENWPVVLPLGVLEYHGEHMALGMDTLVVVKVVELLERETNIVILPPFYYGAASYAVEPPEGNGSIQVGQNALAAFGADLFRSLLRVGFRNIHFIIHHQSENFAVGMPTDLSFKSAARQVIFQYLEETRGEGWWGSNSMADYYQKQAYGDDPFNWIKGHPLFDAEMIKSYPFDHAGMGETSLMLALCPEAVDIDRLDQGRWYTRTAAQASRELGQRGVELILSHLRGCIAE